MTEDVRSRYDARYTRVLSPAVEGLRNLISDHLSGHPRVDSVTARAKLPERFTEKATRRKSNGELKYIDPLAEIQDQLAARVVVLYASDIAPTRERLLKYFRHIEERVLVPEDEWSFGYFGHHFVLAMPTDVQPPSALTNDCPRFFELQIKTLFQHAWSEAEHDLSYKARTMLSADQQRRFAYSAAQAWGADRILDDLFKELSLLAQSPQSVPGESSAQE